MLGNRSISNRIFFVLMLMAGFYAHVLDVCGAFLLGSFEPEHKMYIEVPQGWEKFYPPGVVLLLNKTLYGCRQSALQFWKLMCTAFKGMKFLRNKADACLHFTWTKRGYLLMWITWVDDCVCVGNKEDVMESVEQLKGIFDCDDNGELKEFVGMKLDIDKQNRTMLMTQPVLTQSYNDEFELPGNKQPCPAPAGHTLEKSVVAGDELSAKDQKLYRTGVGKVLHNARWTRPEALHRVRELSQFMKQATSSCMLALLYLMDYIYNTPTRGWYLAPKQTWDGKDRNFEFTVKGKSDSTWASTLSSNSVSGCTTFFCDVPVAVRSKAQGCVTLSVTEAEFVAGVETAQDMLFTMRIVESMGLKVKKPMILEMDNKGAVDLANNWSVAGRTRHVAVRIAFLRELKEQNLLICRWVSNKEMCSDILTKNVGGKDFERHASVYCKMT